MSPPDLSRPRRIHVIGVGGAGMSAYASVLAAMGHAVTGSDLKRSPATDRLEAAGIPVFVGHEAGHLGRADLVAVSSAVPAGNPEWREAERRDVPVVSRADLLASLATERRALAVSGTHGKTTTTSMTALILVEAGLRPSFLIGGDLNEIGTNAVWDVGDWLVLEADESDGTFLHLDPEIAVVTNIEADHLDHYGDLDSLVAAFDRFCTDRPGGVVAGADDELGAAVGARHGATFVGTADGADYRVGALRAGRDGTSFELVHDGAVAARITLPVPGTHNVRNAAVAAVAAHRAGAPFDAAERALARFAGVARRFEFRGESRGVRFVDDYAHLPTEVAAAIEAAGSGGWDRVVAVFQPHRYSRTAALWEEFGPAFAGADLVVVTDVYPAGEQPLPGVTGRLVADAAARGRPGVVSYLAGRPELRVHLAGVLRPGDLCLTLGAGDLTSLADELRADPAW